jgi:hypothetical protein
MNRADFCSEHKTKNAYGLWLDVDVVALFTLGIYPLGRQVRFRTPGFHPARPVFISRHGNASCSGVAISTPFVFTGTTFSIFLLCTFITRELTGSTCTLMSNYYYYLNIKYLS